MPEVVVPNRRLRAAGIHFALSAVVAAAVSLLVFLVWYPPPYAWIAGGLSLFGLLVGVDVVLGPALTAVAASPSKPRAELRRDLIVIVLLQLAAFAYGVHTMALARPVFLSFEIDRLRVVTAADIEPASLAEAPADLRALPWFGPETIAAVKPTKPDELMRSIDLGMSGIDLSMVPANWRDYASQSDAAWRAAKPISALLARHPAFAAEVKTIAAAAGVAPETLRFMPLVSRQANWTSLIAEPGARIVGHLPVDAFF